MADVENGQEIDPLQDDQDDGVADFDADADGDAEVTLDETGEAEAATGQDAGIEDPVPTIGKPRKKRRSYDTSLISKAYKHHKETKMSVYKTAKLFGIPESTLRDRTLGLQPVTEEIEDLPSSGQAPTFTADEEKRFAIHLNYMAIIECGYTRAELLNLAFDWAVTLGKKEKSDRGFSASWYAGFMRRNPGIIIRKSEKLSLLRAKYTSEATLNTYYTELEKVMKKHDLTNRPELIWNVDATVITMDQSPGDVLSVKEVAQQAITSDKGKFVTIIGSGSAAGKRLPPYYVFHGSKMSQKLLTGASPGSNGTVTESGLSDSTVFMKYLNEHFLKHVKTNDHPVLILLDGHKSHVILTLSEWAEDNKIVFFVLPPHTSHITLPVDVGCFGPLKHIYHKECQTFMRRNPGHLVNKHNIAVITAKAYNSRVCAETLRTAFRELGIFPLKRMSIVSTFLTKFAIEEPPVENQDSSHSDDFVASRLCVKVKKIANDTSKRKSTVEGDIPPPTKKILSTPAAKKKVQVLEKNNKKNQNAPQLCSPTGDSVPQTEDSLMDLCCVCNKSTPDSIKLSKTIDKVKWGQCDDCDHWTHLKHCTNVRVLKKYDEFLCPHCDK